MKQYLLILIGLGIVLAGLFFARFALGGSEDSWIKDSRGVYIKHGNPSSIPDYVKEQQDVILCASELYNEAKLEITQFNSQCLGVCNGYAIDIVNVPRNNDDDLVENQCEAFRNKIVNKFIELGKEGNIVRIS